MTKVKCSHCQLKFNENDMIIDEFGEKFCCNGCKQVFNLLKDEGFSDFYVKLGKNSLSPVLNLKTTTSQNTKSFYKNYVKKTKDGFNEIHIIIDGIHCLACVWLNEKILFNAKGIVEAEINASTHKARVVWDENEINLAQIFTLIQSIGYNPYPYDITRSQNHIDTKKRDFYAKLIVGIFATMNIMWIAISLYSGYFSGMDSEIKDIFHFVEFVIATPVLFYTGNAFLKGAIIALKTKTPNMDLLVFSGAFLTYIYSIYAMFSRSGEVYFESVCMIITFVFAGKYLEVASQKKATDTIDSLSNSILEEVKVKMGENFELKDPNLVKKGDIVLINSGDRVLIDGIVKNGVASFDYSSLNGESLPISKEAKDKISSGAICLDGSLEYECSSDFENSILNKIINLIQNASFKKPKIEKLANQISAKFSIIVLSVAFITFFGWYFAVNFEKALIVAISVLVIACPCALGLATPVATLVGLNVGLKNAIIFKEGKVIETLAKSKTIIFDKTGTLTKAKLKVINSEFMGNFDKNLLLNLLKNSNHPVSTAIFEFLNDNSFKSIKFDEFKNVPAKGVVAKVNGLNLLGGSAKFMQENEINLSKSKTTNYFFAINSQIMAKFELQDTLRDEAKSVIGDLKRLGFQIYILSGDNENAVKNIAQSLEIPNFRANLLPDEKAKFIENLSDKNTIMVGDGVNDLVALNTASVGICMGNGATVSVEKSDAVLLNENLKNLKNAILLSRCVLKTIKQNLAFSLCYNAITITIAICGFIIPLFAAISMSFSSLIVILNSLKIRKFKGEK